jgi:hypothetical protein
MGGSVRRNAKIAFRSSSVIFLYTGQGIGGRIGRDFPMCLPVLMAVRNVSSVQIPSPVF